MKKQFLREAHTRQDKTRKSDYRGEMAWDKFCYPGDSSELTPEQRVRKKVELKNEYLKKLEWGSYHKDGIKFKFDWGVKEFARNNRLQNGAPETVRQFEMMKMAANEDYYNIKWALREAKLRRQKYVFEFQLTFKLLAPLVCDEIFLGTPPVLETPLSPSKSNRKKKNKIKSGNQNPLQVRASKKKNIDSYAFTEGESMRFVVKKAWELSSANGLSDEGWKNVKTAALKLIKRVAPSLEAALVADDWAVLRASSPHECVDV